MKKRLLAVLIALGTMFSLPSSAAAYAFTGGYYSEAEIGNLRLSVCFDANSAVYTNRTVIIHGLERAQQGLNNLDWVDYGICDQGNENLQVHIHDYGVNDCGFVTPFAETTPLSYGDTQTHMYFNKNCFDTGEFYLGDSPPVPAGNTDLESVAAHEGLHALGLAHAGTGFAVSNGGAGSPSNCNFWDGMKLSTIAQDDENGLVARYAFIPLAAGDTSLSTYAVCVT